MATTKVTLTSSWQLLVAASKQFIVENPTEFDVQVTFADSAPAGSAPGHKLMNGFGLSRMGATGALYGRIHPEEVQTANAFVIVSPEV